MDAALGEEVFGLGQAGKVEGDFVGRFSSLGVSLKRLDLTGGVILVGVITGGLSGEVVTGEKPSRSSDLWLPFLLSREVVHGVRVVCWMLSNTMPVMVGGVVVIVSRS